MAPPQMTPLFEDVRLEPCPHPPTRLYTGFVKDPCTGEQGMWVACCACGDLLKSGYSAETHARLAAQERQRGAA